MSFRGDIVEICTKVGAGVVLIRVVWTGVFANVLSGLLEVVVAIDQNQVG